MIHLRNDTDLDRRKAGDIRVCERSALQRPRCRGPSDLDRFCRSSLSHCSRWFRPIADRALGNGHASGAPARNPVSRNETPGLSLKGGPDTRSDGRLGGPTRGFLGALASRGAIGAHPCVTSEGITALTFSPSVNPETASALTFDIQRGDRLACITCAVDPLACDWLGERWSVDASPRANPALVEGGRKFRPASG